MNEVQLKSTNFGKSLRNYDIMTCDFPLKLEKKGNISNVFYFKFHSFFKLS